ncbi:hypothetical protein D3C71_1912970 [compost metagenome]
MPLESIFRPSGNHDDAGAICVITRCCVTDADKARRMAPGYLGPQVVEGRAATARANGGRHADTPFVHAHRLSRAITVHMLITATAALHGNIDIAHTAATSKTMG